MKEPKQQPAQAGGFDRLTSIFGELNRRLKEKASEDGDFYHALSLRGLKSPTG